MSITSNVDLFVLALTSMWGDAAPLVLLRSLVLLFRLKVVVLLSP